MSDSTSYTYRLKDPSPGIVETKGFKKVFNYREIGSDTEEEEAEETPEETSEEDEEVVKPKREKPKPKRFMKKRVSSDSENEPLQSKRQKQQAEFFFSKKGGRESSGRNGKSRRQQSNEGMSSSHVFTNFESTKFFHDFLFNGLQSVLFLKMNSHIILAFFVHFENFFPEKKQKRKFCKKKSRRHRIRENM